MNDLILASQQQETDPLLANPHRPGRRAASAASPRDLLFVLFWHRRKVATFFVVALLLTVAAVFAMPNRYLSEGKLLNPLGSELSAGATASLGGPLIQPVMQREMQMKTELEVLKSNEIAESVVKKIGAGPLLRKNVEAVTNDDQDPVFKKALLALKQNLTLDVVPDSNVLSVSFESSDPKLAQSVVSTYIDSYQSHRSKVYTNSPSAKLLENARDLSKQRIDELEDKIRQIKDDAGVGNIDEQRVILQGQIGTLQRDASEARTARITANAQVDSLSEQLKVVPPTIISSRTHNQAMNWVDELRKEIAKLEGELADANARYLPNSPQVKILQDKIASNRALLATANGEGGENTETVNPTYQELNTRLETSRVDARVAQAKEAAITEELKTADAKLKRFNEVEQKIKAMLRSANLDEDTLKAVSQAAGRATLMASFEGEKLNNISVVQPATLPLKPVAPNRLMLLVLGLFVAASGAVGLGIAAETLSRSAKRPEDIDRIAALPCVSVPVVEEAEFVGRPAAKNNGLFSKLLPGQAEKPKAGVVQRAALTNGSTNGRALPVGTADVRPMRRWSPQLLQSAHGIVDGLLFDAILSNKHQNAFITGLVSCRPGQGASTMTSYVASAIADRLEASMHLSPEDQVLLIDSDLAEPTQHRLLGGNDTPGLGDWLMVATDSESSIDSFVQPTNHPRLSLMPAGRSGGASRLLDRMDRLLVEATQTHRHVVIDLPPLSTTPTALRLAAKCNAVLLVVECGNLHQEVVRRSVRTLQAAGARVAGVVLNKRRFPIPDWLYDRAA
ncbi:MAG: polysaccharide biosynthesis tyrosine autokinase [Tepidisphaeraceae bacterium]